MSEDERKFDPMDQESNESQNMNENTIEAGQETVSENSVSYENSQNTSQNTQEHSQDSWQPASQQTSQNTWSSSQQSGPGSYQNSWQQGSWQSNQNAQNPYGGSNSGYENNWQQNSQGHHRHPEHHQKKGSIAKKAAGITAAAVLFGVVAGGVMTGVNFLGSQLTGSYGSSQQASAESEESAAQTAESSAAAETQAAATAVSSTDVSAIVEEAMPCVVAINDTMTVEQRNFFGMTQTYQAQSSGSGFIIDESDTELLIATNNHVVSGAEELTVTFTDDTAVSAAIKGTDAASDLAIVAVQLSDIPADTMSRIEIATLGDSDTLKVGQQVIAIGNALGYGQSVTVGYVSALDRQIQDEDGNVHTYIQTDAAINPGNSGGALLDMNGNVIGINAAKTASTEVEGMGYAIPISKAQEILNQLMTKKTRIAVAEDAQGSLGIRVTNIDSATSRAYGMPVGVYVYQIMENGAAASSELKEKDIITKFDGQSISTMEELTDMLTYYESGSQVTLTVQRLEDGQYVEHEIEITLGSKADIQEDEQSMQPQRP